MVKKAANHVSVWIWDIIMSYVELYSGSTEEHWLQNQVCTQ